MTTDLLGDPVPATPAMTDPLPWRVYRLNDCEWWMARSLDEAIADWMAQTGVGAEGLDDPEELSDAELDRLVFVDDEVDPPVKRSFREELALRAETAIAPGLFAGTEW